jgi:membrane protease YdiL (CAAX protease family)
LTDSAFNNSPPEIPPPDREKTDSLIPSHFRTSKLSYITLIFLLLIWPAASIVMLGDPKEALNLISASPILLVYLPTIVTQWLLFLLIFLTAYREETGLKGVGFKRIRLIDFFIALAFLLVSNLILSLSALVLNEIGLAIPGEIELLLPETGVEKIFWVILSLTAGICEEVAFRGYLITRLKILGKAKSWIMPVIVSSIIFGSGHSYQGLGGFILLTIYGAMFAALFIKTNSLWPCIIAHFFQDFGALFYPYSS